MSRPGCGADIRSRSLALLMLFKKRQGCQQCADLKGGSKTVNRVRGAKLCPPPQQNQWREQPAWLWSTIGKSDTRTAASGADLTFADPGLRTREANVKSKAPLHYNC